MDWHTILSEKTFWIYYWRLFRGFAADGARGRVAACCAFFDVTPEALERSIVRGLYQTHRYDDPDLICHALRLAFPEALALEIAFQPYGPNEHLRLVGSGEALTLADVDIDDVAVPMLPLRDVPCLAATAQDDLGRTYGPALLYKLVYPDPVEEETALEGRLRHLLPSGVFGPREADVIVAGTLQRYAHQRSRPSVPRTPDHPLFRRWLQRGKRHAHH